MPAPPRRVRPGDEISAEQWNRLVELASAGSVVRSTELFGRVSGAALLLGLGRQLGGRGLGNRVIFGRIAAVVVTAGNGGAGLPSRPSAVTYDVKADDFGWTQTGVTPRMGRPVTADEVAIYPAAVGDVCLAFREPDGEGRFINRWFIHETVANGPCNPGAGGAP